MERSLDLRAYDADVAELPAFWMLSKAEHSYHSGADGLATLAPAERLRLVKIGFRSLADLVD